MANVVNVFKMMDGPSHVTLQVYLASDGASGELTDYILLDPTTDLSPAMPARQDLIIKQIWHELDGFNVTLSFNALTPWPAWLLAPNAGQHQDWRFFGGIRDRSDYPLGLNSDGKLLISTKGFTDASDRGALVLWLEKRDKPNPQSDS